MAHDPLFGLDVGAVRNIDAKELIIRFAFGATISIVAGLSSVAFGSVVGGLLLAFPAILPAALTLIERQDGNDAAVHDVGGAILGGVGLMAFAATGFVALGTIPAPAALIGALGVWGVVSVGLYVLRATKVLPLPASIAGRRPVPPRTDGSGT